MNIFNKSELKRLYTPAWESSNEDNGSVTIIGGSELFHGAPLLSLKVASRLVDMVFFSSPEPSIGRVAEKIKSKLFSFIWVPWDEVGEYIKKSDAVLIGPGMMRFKRESDRVELINSKKIDSEGKKTKEITETLLKKYSKKRWVIDAGSLQVIDSTCIPKGSIITPNKREFESLFDVKLPNEKDQHYESDTADLVSIKAKEINSTIVLKGPRTCVCTPDYRRWIEGGNPGLTKGGTGDVLAGLTVALYAKNDMYLSACAASYIVKAAGDELYENVGVNYNADDLTEAIPEVLKKLIS